MKHNKTDKSKYFINLVKQAEKKARKLNAQIDNCHIQFDNAREVLSNAYPEAWKEYCESSNLSIDYTWGDTLC